MHIINQNSPIPIKDQLFEYFERLILTGALRENEQLPSVRSLAKDLLITPNTIHKVYQELTEANLVTAIPQKGVFVATIKKEKLDKYIEEEKKIFLSSYNNLKKLNVTKEEIIQLLN
ncbi:MAG: GntR family transcriptional regulator [Lachnospirales bacterium]